MDLVHKINELRDQPSSYWVNAANQHLPDIFSFLLAVIIAWYLARLIWVLAPQSYDFDWSVRSVVTTTMPGGPAVSSGTYRTIANAHLFGEPGSEPAIVASTVDAPETRLNLKLRATIAADDDSLAHAIIADGKGKDEVYFLGDTVTGGAKLHEVNTDRVILNRGGALETLKLPKLSEALGKQPVARAASPARPSGPTASIRETMQQSSASFTNVLRPQPYMPNGELRGYRVYPGRDRRRFAALGFRPGDLVTDINGQKLDNLQAGMEIFSNLGDTTQLSITIERDGSPVVMNLDTTQFLGGDGDAE